MSTFVKGVDSSYNSSENVQCLSLVKEESKMFEGGLNLLPRQIDHCPSVCSNDGIYRKFSLYRVNPVNIVSVSYMGMDTVLSRIESYMTSDITKG
jgi:hypothetical protein